MLTLSTLTLAAARIGRRGLHWQKRHARGDACQLRPGGWAGRTPGENAPPNEVGKHNGHAQGHAADEHRVSHDVQ